MICAWPPHGGLKAGLGPHTPGPEVQLNRSRSRTTLININGPLFSTCYSLLYFLNRCSSWLNGCPFSLNSLQVWTAVFICESETLPSLVMAYLHCLIPILIPILVPFLYWAFSIVIWIRLSAMFYTVQCSHLVCIQNRLPFQMWTLIPIQTANQMVILYCAELCMNSFS